MGIFKGTALFASGSFTILSHATTNIGVWESIPGQLTLTNHPGGPLEVMYVGTIQNTAAGNVLDFGIGLNGGTSPSIFMALIGVPVANENIPVTLCGITPSLPPGTVTVHAMMRQTIAGTLTQQSGWLFAHDMGGHT